MKAYYACVLLVLCVTAVAFGQAVPEAVPLTPGLADVLGVLFPSAVGWADGHLQGIPHLIAGYAMVAAALRGVVEIGIRVVPLLDKAAEVVPNPQLKALAKTTNWLLAGANWLLAHGAGGPPASIAKPGPLPTTPTPPISPTT